VKYKRFMIASLLAPLAVTCNAETSACGDFCRPFYVGATAGYGSTTWSGLVPNNSNQNDAMVLSTPINVEEGGALWGLFAGYEFNSFFALEAGYMRYPVARVNFDPDSLFTFNNDGQTSFYTHTETGSLIGKIMMMIPRTKARAFSSAGVAVVHRWDQLANQRRVTPTFGLGINYNFTEYIMAELGGSYTAGFGQSELNPANDYMPFLYAGYFRLAYRI
jgi:hypothetical protein